MDITLIVLAISLLLATTVLLLFLFKGINIKSFKAEDGSVFYNKSDLDIYNNLYVKTKSLFLVENQQKTNTPIMGFDKSFLIKLTNEGFPDFKTLYKYRKQFKSLSDLIDL